MAILARVDTGSVRSTLRDIDVELVARMREHVESYAASRRCGGSS